MWVGPRQPPAVTFKHRTSITRFIDVTLSHCLHRSLVSLRTTDRLVIPDRVYTRFIISPRSATVPSLASRFTAGDDDVTDVLLRRFETANINVR